MFFRKKVDVKDLKKMDVGMGEIHLLQDIEGKQDKKQGKTFRFVKYYNVMQETLCALCRKMLGCNWSSIVVWILI